MADIKTKDKQPNAGPGAIRSLDRARLLREKTKENIIRTKQGIQRINSDADNETNYAEDRVMEMSQDVSEQAEKTVKRGAEKVKDKAEEKIRNKIEEHFERDQTEGTPENLDGDGDSVPNGNNDYSQKPYSERTTAENSTYDRKNAYESGRSRAKDDYSQKYKTDKTTSDRSNQNDYYRRKNTVENGNHNDYRHNNYTSENSNNSKNNYFKRYSEGNITAQNGNSIKVRPDASIKTSDKGIQHISSNAGQGAKGGAQTIKQASSSGIKTANHSIKTVNHSLKTAETTARTTIKTTEKAAQAAQKSAQATAKASREAAVAAKSVGTATAKAASVISKAASAAVKAIGAVAKEGFTSIAGMMAGAGPIIILIFVLAAVAVLCTGDAAHRPNSDIDTQKIIQEINGSWMEQIDKLTEPYDEANTEGTRAPWQEIMAIYAAKSSASSVDNWEQERELKTIFWEMHSLFYKVELVIEPKQIPELPTKIRMKEADCEFLYFADGTLYKQETVTYQNEKDIAEILKEYEGREHKQVISIEIHHKSMEEMMDKYDFTDWQREQAEMLVSEEFDEFWLDRVFNLNTNVASSSVQKALIESCMSTPAAASGYCATWVHNVYANAGIGGIGGNADDMWAAYCYTNDRSKLQPGMIIAVNSTGYSGDGYLYGHVGIYVGDNTVMHSTGGAVVTNTLDDWIAIYDTYGTVRWGFPDGVSVGDDSIASVALSQVGNTGGQPYWSYCGYSSRVEWCACFVSWCADQCGYISSGQFIKTASPPAQASFFKKAGQWMDGSGTPNPGMVIFFDWNNVEFADHCGIVERVENGYVYTIEGNSKDAVRRGTWRLGDGQIMGYGWIKN